LLLDREKGGRIERRKMTKVTGIFANMQRCQNSYHRQWRCKGPLLFREIIELTVKIYATPKYAVCAEYRVLINKVIINKV